MKVLIADDEINIILLIKSLIDRQKTDVEIAGEAGDGITALEMVRQLKPDVVITDIRMPGMNGMDLIRHVREEQIPVEFVIISGYSEFEYARSAIQYGVSDYLLKPIKKDELNDVLAKLEARGPAGENSRCSSTLWRTGWHPTMGYCGRTFCRTF